MVKLPKEVGGIVKSVAEAGFKIYAVGGCVRDALLGKNPIDWDLATSASLEDLVKILPEAKVLSQELSVVRLDLSGGEEEGLVIDIATMREDGPYSSGRKPDYVTFTDEIEEDLKRRDFTINAMADSPGSAIVDPFGGRGDINAKLIRSVGDPAKRYAEDPLRMFRAIRLAAQLDFDIHKSDYEAMVKNAHKAGEISKDLIRKEFEEIMVADAAGKGLRMLAGADLMPAIVGEKTVNLNQRQSEQFAKLADNIHKTQKNLQRRLGLFYCCFEEKKGKQAMETLNYDSETSQHILDGLLLTDKMYFIRNGLDIKEWLLRYGKDRYEYLHNLSKARRIVYEQSEVKIANRNHIMEDIITRGEPIYVEDVAIGGQDLIDEGIATGEEIGDMLLKLLDVVHRRPDFNNREKLIKTAKKFKKNPLAATFRKTRWLR